MTRFVRKTTPKVIGGKVQRKNRTTLTPNYWNSPQPFPFIDRQKPGKGHRHLLRKRDIQWFCSLLPDWDELSRGLNAIVLATHDEGMDGWHHHGVVAVCAWTEDLWNTVSTAYFEAHRDIFERLEVPCEKRGDRFLCKFNEHQARAYQLLHVLLHELGHHHDRMTTRSRRAAARGEGYAEQYARRYEAQIWGRYQRLFQLF